MVPFEVSISGIGGRFPESDDLLGFRKHIFTGESLATKDSRRWKPGTLGVSPHVVKLNSSVHHFDNNFFAMHRRLTFSTDPVFRKICECAVEAIMDAGINPKSLYGTNAHVYAAVSINESEIVAEFSDHSKYSIMGTNRSMIANRVSFFLNLTGTSVTLGGDWTAGVRALERASSAIRQGECDVALVLSGALALHPELSRILGDMGFVSPDGKCQPFHPEGSGWARGEACVALVLQRPEQARRVYAHVAAVGESSLGQRSGLIAPDATKMAAFLAELYRESSVDPLDVGLLQAHGAAVPALDSAELVSAAALLCKGRTTPLPVTSVRGVVGHADACSALLSVVAGIIALDTQYIPPVKKCNSPSPHIQPLVDGRMEVIGERRLWRVGPRAAVAVSCVGLGGSVGHVILRANPRHKPPVTPEDQDYPRLIIASARTEAQVQQVVKRIANTPFDPEYIRLTQEVFADQFMAYNHRAFTVLPSGLQDPAVHYKETTDVRRPLWLVYSGMGSQWVGMGSHLLRLPVFTSTIDRLHDILKPKGLNLRDIISSDHGDILDDIMNSFVGIAAIQIGLTNILRSLGVEVAGLIGHSVGELGCAYADGGLTEEQTILAAHARGRASVEANLVPGMMAAIGLGWKDVRPYLPDTVDVACHNATDNCTVSGPAMDVQRLVADLKDKGVFARAVNVSNIAYHSRYIRPAAPSLLAYLKEVIPKPVARSPRWVSSSVPEDRLDTQNAKMCSAEYHTNNLLSPVLFEEAMRAVPDGAVVLEVAPHGLLQAVIRRGLPEKASTISLTQRGCPDGLVFLLRAVGMMFLEGIPVRVSALSPEVPLPVSRGTPSLTNLATWDHRDEWPLESRPLPKRANVVTLLPLSSPMVKLDGRRFYPPSCILEDVWSAFTLGMPLEEHPVVFENLLFLEPVYLPDNDELEIEVQLQEQTGSFEVSALGRRVVHGKIRSALEDDLQKRCGEHRSPGMGCVKLSAQDVYAELLAHGLSYPDHFKSLREVEVSEKEWRGRVTLFRGWKGLLDGVLQMEQLSRSELKSALHCAIRKIVIVPGNLPAGEATVAMNLLKRSVSCSGLWIEGFRAVAPTSHTDSATSGLQVNIVPYSANAAHTGDEFLSLVAQILLQNNPHVRQRITLLELPGARGFHNARSTLKKSFVELVGGQVTIEVVQVDPARKLEQEISESSVLVLSGVNDFRTGVAERTLIDIIARTTATPLLLVHGIRDTVVGSSSVALVMSSSPCAEPMLLIAKALQESDFVPEPVVVSPSRTAPPVVDFSPGRRVLLVWEDIPQNGVLGALERARRVPYSNRTTFVFIVDQNAPPFSWRASLYADQLKMGTAVNILHGGQWGTIALQPLPVIPTEPRMECEEIFYASEVDRNILNFCGMRNGRREMGVAFRDESGAVVMSNTLHWGVPDSWTSEGAASVPSAYATSYWALSRGTLTSRKNNTVLVMEGASSVGTAAIRVALEFGFQVFAVASSPQQCTGILRNNPELGEESVLFAANFETNIRMKTRGRGVDVVLCPADGVDAALRCVGAFGQVVLVGDCANLHAKSVGMRVFLSSVSLHRGGVLSILDADDSDQRSLVRALRTGLSKGTVRPLEGERVFRPRPEQSYLVVGGTGEEVVSVTRAIRKRGASHFTLAPATPDVVLPRALTAGLKLRGRCTVLEAPRSPASASQLVARATEGVLFSAVIIIEDGTENKLADLMDGALRETRPDVPLVTLTTSLAFVSTRVVETRRREGFPASAVVGHISQTSHVLPRLLSLQRLPMAVFIQDADRGSSFFSPAEDTGAGRDFDNTSWGHCGEVRSVELTTRALRRRHLRGRNEPATLFAVLGTDSLAEVRALGRNLMSPLVVLLPALDVKGAVHSAMSVAEEVLRIQPRGPWALLADVDTASLARSVATELERSGVGHTAVAVLDEFGRWWASHQDKTVSANSGSLHVLQSGTTLRSVRMSERCTVHAVPQGDKILTAGVINEHLLSLPYSVIVNS